MIITQISNVGFSPTEASYDVLLVGSRWVILSESQLAEIPDSDIEYCCPRGPVTEKRTWETLLTTTQKG